MVDSGSIVSARLQWRAALAQAATDTGPCWYPDSHCTVTFTAVPTNYHCAIDGCIYDYSQPPGMAQHDPITVTFSKPVYRLIVYDGGAFSCSGTYGTVTAYSRTYSGYFQFGGRQVEQRDFIINDPSDCGYDGVTGLGVDTLRFPGGIAKLVLDPPEPWEFLVPTGDATPPDTGHVTVEYYYHFYERRAPTAPCVTGDELLDQQAMRDMLSAALDSSNLTDAQINRRETRGWLFEDSTGNLVYGVYPERTPNPIDGKMDTPCSSIGIPPTPEPGVRVARGHSHSFAPPDTILPPVCGYTEPSGDDMRFGGPSKGDILNVAQEGIPGYIVDRINLYVIPVGTDTLNARSMVKSYPRVDPVSGCTRL